MFQLTNKKVFGWPALLALGAMLSACQPQSASKVGVNGAMSGVVNGQTANEADVSPQGLAESVVVIQARAKEGAFLCTGTLIDPRVVLTAGHCLPEGASNADIVVGLHFLDIKAKTGGPDLSAYRVQSYIVHPGYASKSGSQNDDLALLLLAKPVPAGTRMARLPDADVSLDNVSKLVAIGYGQSDDHHNAADSGSGVLRYTSFPVSEFGQLPDDPKIPAFLRSMLASKAKTTSVCHGDSGGPLMAMNPDGSTSNIIIGVNDLVLPQYEGQEGIDYANAMKAGDLDLFYSKHPDARVCMGGLNVFVNVPMQVEWITTSMQNLLAPVH